MVSVTSARALSEMLAATSAMSSQMESGCGCGRDRGRDRGRGRGHRDVGGVGARQRDIGGVTAPALLAVGALLQCEALVVHCEA